MDFAGSMLVAPTGLCKTGESALPLNVAYVFARGAWKTPLLQLPATKVCPSSASKHFGSMTRHATVTPNILDALQPVVAARFCPVLFSCGPEPSSLPIDLPYKMVVAVATKDSVMLYDTQVSCLLVSFCL